MSGRSARLLLALACSLTCSLGVDIGAGVQALAAPAADVERLARGLPPGFRRPRVIIYPPLDQRLLSVEEQEGDRAVMPPPLEAWTVFLDELRAARNLAIDSPGLTVRGITDRVEYRRRIVAVHRQVVAAEQDYRGVRLEAAADGLESAVQTYLELEHHIVDPTAVARAALTRGLALLELGEPVRAAASMQQALTIDPGLRLRPGFDLPRSIDALDDARRALLALGPPAPTEFTPRPRRAQRASHIIRARLLPDRIEITLTSVSGTIIEVQPLGDDPRSAGSRLAGRVKACLPFGRSPKPDGHQPRLALDAGFDLYTFATRPVEPFANLGVGVHLSWLAAPGVQFILQGSIANGERDPQEHLRRDVATARGRVGAGYVWSRARWSLFADVGVEAASMSELVITTNPACKYFTPRDAIPSVLCDFERDIDTTPRAWLVGPSIAAGGRVRLVDQIFLTMRLSTTSYVFESVSNGFDWPFGGGVALGYRLF